MLHKRLLQAIEPAVRRTDWQRYCLPVTLSMAALTGWAASALPSNATTLFGSIKHSEFLPPLANQYSGAPLRGKVNDTDISYQARRSPYTAKPVSNESLNYGLPAAKNTQSSQGVARKTVVWVPIPKWLAGKWVKQGDLTINYTDLRTGVTTRVNQWTENYQVTDWGNQFDAQGNIWHGYLMPTELDGLSNGKVVKFVIVNGRPEQCPAGHLVTRVHSVVFESAGGQLLDTFQQETLNDLYMLSSGELENQGNTRDFTEQGLPIREGTLISRFTRAGPFEPVEVQEGVDLLSSLNDYLRSHNMNQLVRTSVAGR